MLVGLAWAREKAVGSPRGSNTGAREAPTVCLTWPSALDPSPEPGCFLPGCLFLGPPSLTSEL